MIARRLTLLVLLSLTACAALRSDPAPTCDGRHRRPANPYGSVLASPAAPASAQTSEARSPQSRAPQAPSPPPTSFPSCP